MECQEMGPAKEALILNELEGEKKIDEDGKRRRKQENNGDEDEMQTTWAVCFLRASGNETNARRRSCRISILRNQRLRSIAVHR